MSFHTISNILNGVVPLQTAIDNSNYDKRIGIRSLTIWIGWYNTNKDSWMAIIRRIDLDGNDNDPSTGIAVGASKQFNLRPGLKGARDIILLGSELQIVAINPDGSLKLNPDGTAYLDPVETNPISIDYDSGICTVTVPDGVFLSLTDDIRTALGLIKTTNTIKLDTPDNTTITTYLYGGGVYTQDN